MATGNIRVLAFSSPAKSSRLPVSLSRKPVHQGMVHVSRWLCRKGRIGSEHLYMHRIQTPLIRINIRPLLYKKTLVQSTYARFFPVIKKMVNVLISPEWRGFCHHRCSPFLEPIQIRHARNTSSSHSGQNRCGTRLQEYRGIFLHQNRDQQPQAIPRTSRTPESRSSSTPTSRIW